MRYIGQVTLKDGRQFEGDLTTDWEPDVNAGNIITLKICHLTGIELTADEYNEEMVIDGHNTYLHEYVTELLLFMPPEESDSW